MSFSNSVNATSCLLQQVRTQVTALQHITAHIPYDDTIPQSNEGTQVFTVTIRPAKTTNILVIDCVIECGAGGTDKYIVSLFQDAGVNAIAAVATTLTNTFAGTIKLTYWMTAGTTSSTTFAINAGAVANNMDINGTGANARVFGGVCTSYLEVTEYIS